MKLYEPCVNNNQCNGTNNAGNCTEIENSTLCYCQDEYLDFKGRCIKGIFLFNSKMSLFFFWLLRDNYDNIIELCVKSENIKNQ